MVVQAAARCLKVIQPDIDISDKLPQNMASRFHLSSAIAQACKGLGYNGDVGYQTFLYSNVGDVRRVFMFLIEKLPREVEKQLEIDVDPVSKLMTDIGREIRRRLDLKTSVKRTLSVPFLSVPLETGIITPDIQLKGSPKEWKEHVIHNVPFLTEQTKPDHFLPSAIVMNAKGLLNKSEVKSTDASYNHLEQNDVNAFSSNGSEETWLTMMESLIFAKDESAKLNSISSENSGNNIDHSSPSTADKITNSSLIEKEPIINEDPLQKMRNNIEELQIAIKKQQVILDKIEEDCKRELIIAGEKSYEIEFHGKALSLLPQAEENLGKIEESIKFMSDKILSLSVKWESYRKPLIEKYIGAKSKMANKESQNEKEHDKMKQLKGKIEVINKQLVAKRGIIAQLEEEYDKLPKNINRSAYTRRIMEIIGNIKKQKDEIEKILKDTKALQKETNSLNGRLERLFAVCEETIFRNTKKDEFSKRTFNLLTTLHSDCTIIGSLVLEIGTISREITDLKEQIEIESSKNITANLERISADLEQMKVESKSLTNQIKKLQSISDVHSHPLL
ncbi:coiled-coil domain-containing protein 22 homolog isoform X2 [Halyomorpha halys]|nr:coiled-coil domain-containing protein 22 homolog isoform X2 [Halyomorpha halys]